MSDIAANPSGRQTPARDRAALTRLTLSDFRNYDHLSLRLAPASVVLCGDNGAGKTNLLEAISLLGPGRGFRRVALGECARHEGAGGWAVAAEVESAAGPVRLGTGIEGGEGPERTRKCRIDGAPVSGPGAFGEHLHVLWLTPAMDRLFTGPAGDRRRFVDRTIAAIDAQHRRSAGRYERAMSERNRLLALGRREETWLDGLEAQMAEAGVAVAAARIAAIRELEAVIEGGSGQSAFPPARLAMEGTLESALSEQAAVDVEDRFRAEAEAGPGARPGRRARTVRPPPQRPCGPARPDRRQCRRLLDRRAEGALDLDRAGEGAARHCAARWADAGDPA